MATRVKHLRITTSITADDSLQNVTSHTTNTPSTAGDITTRVLIDRITVAGLNTSNPVASFRLQCGGIDVARFSTSNLGSNSILVLSGSNSTSYSTNSTSGALRFLDLSGSGALLSSGIDVQWFCPAQFYSQIGDYFQIAVSNGGGTVSTNLNLICIGEY